MVEADAVAVVCARRLCLPKTDVHTSRSAEVDDALATLANDLACPRVPEWPEQPAVEREASVEVGYDQIEVIDARSSHDPQAT
jgi:hypothetical protein